MKIVLAGTSSAVGKTTIATGIMKALSEKHNIQPFKVGPDYIDPSYHTLATGNPSRNLDSFFMTDYQIINVFNQGLKKSNSEIGIIEGVRGLYEGISPTGDVGNTASIAKALDAPVILILDARSLVKSAAAVVLGFKSLDPSIKIEGVILNKVRGKKHYLKAKESVEKLTDTKVIGGIPRDDSLMVKQRHLGLVPALEKEKIINNIDIWSNIIKKYIDLDLLMDIIKQSKFSNIKENMNILHENNLSNINNNISSTSLIENYKSTDESTINELWKIENKNPVKIGVAKDEIFSFYYQDTFDALKDNNAKIIYFSPYKDENLPDVDALYIGGGYPELFKKELSNNISMINSIKKFHEDHLPIYAECGGLIYLSQSIDNIPMVNALPYKSEMTSHVQGLSYVIGKASKDSIISEKNDILRGHEFHYTKILPNDNTNFVFDVQRGKGIINSMDGIILGNTVASYLHIHPCSYTNFAYNFTKNSSF